MTPTPSPMPYSPRPKRSSRGLVKILVALVALGGLWYAFGHGKAKELSGPPPVAVRTATVVVKPVPVTIRAVGNVVAYESVAVRARLDSQITAVHFKDGDEVKAGDVLFELDDKSLRAQAAQLSANIARDRALLENARRQSERAEALAKEGFATKATQDDTSAAAASAQATLSASVAALESVKVQLGYTRITAPISGRTGTINFTLGNNIKANDTQPLVTINQLKPIRVQASLPQQYFDIVRNAMQAGPVTVTAIRQDDIAMTGNTSSEGTLDYIDNAVDQATGTFVTRAGFPNDSESLLPGMFVNVNMTLGREQDALTVPEVAIQRGQASDFVFIIQDNKALRREVKVARLQDNLAVIASGIAAGDNVAIDGVLGLKDGATVTVQNDAAPTEVAPAAEKTP